MKKKIVPQNDMVLCTLASSNEKTIEGSDFKYESNDLLLYKIEDIGPKVNCSFKKGDIVIVNSTGTKATLDGIDYYLFKEENVIGKTI